MVDQSVLDELSAEEELGPVLPRRPVEDTAELDITPMIDITFLLLIFFLVASIPDMETAVELPPARHGGGVNARNSVILTIAESAGAAPARVYLADGKIGRPLPDDLQVQQERILAAVESGYAEGKPTVLVKAEKGVKHRDVSRVVAAAGGVEGVHLHLAVMEIE